MSYKQKIKVTDLTSDSKKKINNPHENVRKRRYNIEQLDDMRGNGVILDMLLKVAPHLLGPIAEAVGTRVSKFIKGEGARLAGNGTRLAGNGTRLAGNGVRLAGDVSTEKRRHIRAKRAPKNMI